ncbi:hypothetical protein E3W21_05350 [Pseudomonas sp. F01002]|nr:hypothetical protein E3W21_05350 [Pseudomonas sp. F01002]
MAEFEIHFMGLLMQKVGMRSGLQHSMYSAGRALGPLYFGARMSHQSVGTKRRNLRRLYEMIGIPVSYPPNGVPERLLSLFVTVVRTAVANSPAPLCERSLLVW